jgi:hypothetical protein
VAWRRCSGQCRCPWWRGCSRSDSAPFPNADSLLFPPRGGGCGLRPWRVVGVPMWPRLSSARRSGSAPFTLPLTALSQEKRKGKTPMGVGSLGARVSAPLPLNLGAAIVEAKAPSCPGFDRPGGRGGSAPLCADQDAEVRGAGAKGVTPVRGRIRLACARAPVPRRAGRPDGKGVPSRAPAAAAWLAWCGAVRGEGSKDENELLTDTRARSVGERKGSGVKGWLMGRDLLLVGLAGSIREGP